MTVVCFSDGQQRASVELAIQPSESVLKFVRAPEMATFSRIFDAEESQDVSDFTAAVAAVQSGVIFASKKASVKNLQVTILRLKGSWGTRGIQALRSLPRKNFLTGLAFPCRFKTRMQTVGVWSAA